MLYISIKRILNLLYQAQKENGVKKIQAYEKDKKRFYQIIN